MAGLVSHLQRHLNITLDMLESHARRCPPRLWREKVGGFVFWQQILHAVTGALYWTRPRADERFVEPFVERHLFPELERDPEGTVSRAELTGLIDRLRDQVGDLLAGRPDTWLGAPCAISDELSNADVLLMQVRHLGYHVGHLDAALRDRGEEAVPWLEYDRARR